MNNKVLLLVFICAIMIDAKLRQPPQEVSDQDQLQQYLKYQTDVETAVKNLEELLSKTTDANKNLTDIIDKSKLAFESNKGRMSQDQQAKFQESLTNLEQQRDQNQAIIGEHQAKLEQYRNELQQNKQKIEEIQKRIADADGENKLPPPVLIKKRKQAYFDQDQYDEEMRIMSVYWSIQNEKDWAFQQLKYLNQQQKDIDDQIMWTEYEVQDLQSFISWYSEWLDFETIQWFQQSLNEKYEFLNYLYEQKNTYYVESEAYKLKLDVSALKLNKFDTANSNFEFIRDYVYLNSPEMWAPEDDYYNEDDYYYEEEEEEHWEEEEELEEVWIQKKPAHNLKGKKQAKLNKKH